MCSPFTLCAEYGHYLHLDINMCSWENLLIQNSVQEIDGGGPGVMDLTVFGERERVFAVVRVISPRLSDSLRRAKQNKIIFVWFHSSQRRRAEKKKVISLLFSSFSVYRLFSPPCRPRKRTRAQTDVTARQVFLIISVSVSLLWGGGEFPTRGTLINARDM